MHQLLPPHVREALDEAWAAKLEEQANVWKNTRSERRSVLSTAIVVVRRPKRGRSIFKDRTLSAYQA